MNSRKGNAMTANTNERVPEQEFDADESEKETLAAQPLTSGPVMRPDGNTDPYKTPPN
jgi:hypothetical protein